MTIAYFDCFHGAAGDMLLASLFDAGLEPAALEEVLAVLPLGGYTIQHQRTSSHQVSGSRVRVRLHEPQPSRTWADIRTMLEGAALPERTRAGALGAFGRLARAEAHVHGVAVDTVHFHEVGAVDSIVDMVGFCAGLELLGVEQVYASALPLGGGWVATQHGQLPVPAPATLALLAEVGAPTLPSVTGGEVLTPTAAALLAELARFEQPLMSIQRVGYGFGHKEFGRLNGLRVWLGLPLENPWEGWERGAGHEHDHHHHGDHTHDHDYDYRPDPRGHERVVEVRCNLDDASGEIVAYTIERLLEAGALDAWAAPLVMKKGRPAVQLCCLARPADVESLAHLILRETPTLGVRWETMQRIVAERRIVWVETPWGTVRLKQKILAGEMVASAPEYDDCAALARANHIPLAMVYTAAIEQDATTYGRPPADARSAPPAPAP
jgi:pyridinium-3,5-bisthiocarboxylic acid mononucleotide nickel chelatase